MFSLADYIGALLGLAAFLAALAPGCPQQPKASFFANPSEGKAPFLCMFYDRSTGGPDAWAWDFDGDGIIDTTEQNPAHVYPVPGTYTVSLTVSREGVSNTYTREDYIVVRELGEGAVEGEEEGVPEGTEEGSAEGMPEGSSEGGNEGYLEGEEEGQEEHHPGESRTFATIEFSWIPAGAFEMGSFRSAEELSDMYGDRILYFIPEHPQHHIVISRGFWMGKYEITQAQWVAFIGCNPSYYDGANLPVEQVPYQTTTDGEGNTEYGVEEFLVRLNALGQGVFRLPTEAEWEYACRAGSTTEWFFGDDIEQFDTYGWWFLSIADYHTHPIGLKLPNAWNLYDTHGNVLEWCQDWYDENYYSVSPETDPLGPDTGVYRVRRGGSIRQPKSLCRSAFRTWNRPDWSTPDTGFRILREADN